MFKKTRRKIVAAILSVLVLLLFGTLCVIYLASYGEMTNENRALLEQYVNAYSLPGTSDIVEPESGRTKDDRGGPTPSRLCWSSPPFTRWPCPRTARC